MLNVFDMEVGLFAGRGGYFHSVFFPDRSSHTGNGCFINDDRIAKGQRKFCKAPAHLGYYLNECC